MPKTIALFGSSRRGGNTGRFMDHIAELSGIEVVDLGELNISAYDYSHRNRGDDFEGLMSRVLDFDNIIIASPVYWYAACGESPPILSVHRWLSACRSPLWMPWQRPLPTSGCASGVWHMPTAARDIRARCTRPRSGRSCA